jgi:hypothetical protein
MENNMDRRTFLKLSAVLPFTLKSISCQGPSAQTTFLPGGEAAFDLLEVKGSYQQIGYQIGKYFKKNILEILNQREDWHQKLMNALTTEKGRKLSMEYQRITQKYFPHLYREIESVAEGAGIGFEKIWAMTLKSELATISEENLGCSTIFYSDKDKMWLFHNEDGHAAYYDQMFTIKVHPPSGVSFVTMVYPGIITGNGPSLNSKGIIQTTNFIGSTQAEIGLPRHIIGRAILEAQTLKEAEQIASMHPRAYPYHHNLASLNEKKYISIETIPGYSESNAPTGLFYHTNHLLYKSTKKFEFEDIDYKNSSSVSRYEVIEAQKERLINKENLQPEDFLQVLAMHENTPYSPCRHSKDDIKGQTLGTAFFDINNGTFRLYKGNPCQAVESGHFMELGYNG